MLEQGLLSFTFSFCSIFFVLLFAGLDNAQAEYKVSEPVPVSVLITDRPNTFDEPGPYIPAQAVAPYCDRLNEQLRMNVCGMRELSEYTQDGLSDGVAFKEGVHGTFEIHHRRGGARCNRNAMFILRMEMYQQLAKLTTAVRVGQKTLSFSDMKQEYYHIRPGRAEYKLVSADPGLEIYVTAVAPAAVPFYGVFCEYRIVNTGTEAVEAELVTSIDAIAEVPDFEIADMHAGSHRRVVYHSPQENPMLNHHINPARRYLHSTDYSVIAGFAGGRADDDKMAAWKKVTVPGEGESVAYFAAVIDSPENDPDKVRETIKNYFDQNQNLPGQLREEMARQAYHTHYEIVTDGEKAYERVIDNPDELFAKCVEDCANGFYRDRPVVFRLPDQRLEGFANLAANDLMPGIVQPPGIVHDAKYVDIWNYIFCYRHVHAAADLGYEKYAGQYLKLLSAGQAESGWIKTIQANFFTPAHPTRFEASYINTLLHYYRWTGDKSSIEQLWPTMVGAIKFLDSTYDKNNDNIYSDFLNQWKSDFDDRTPNSTFQTALVHRACLDMAEMAEIIGRSDEQKHYLQKAKKIKQAGMRELSSDEMAMLCTSGPLGIKRYHPQSLEVEIPIWTEFVDEFQAAILADWYFANHEIRDENGGIWMYDNDWWPAVWSQHVPAPGDYLMVAWALMLTGSFDEGANILETLAGASARNNTPGFSYIFSPDGKIGGDDPGTVQGAWNRALVEGLFGVAPNVDKGFITLTPRFPDRWEQAAFERDKLNVSYEGQDGVKVYEVGTEPELLIKMRVPVRCPVTQVKINGQVAEYESVAGMRHCFVELSTPRGGGTVEVRTAARDWSVSADKQDVRPGETFTVSLTGVDDYEAIDSVGIFDVVKKQADRLTLRVKRKASGRATIFLKLRIGNVSLIQPVSVWTMERTAREYAKRTVTEPVPEGRTLVQLDLSSAYTDDIQTCFDHMWKYDSHALKRGMGYWSLPLFVLEEELPREIKVGDVPFLIGPMGPGESEKDNDLLMLANTEPHELPTTAMVKLNPARVEKIYLLSLNMNLPQKCYVPAVEVKLHYEDGTQDRQLLIPPINFDSYYQDFGINTAAYFLPSVPGHGQTMWYPAFHFDLSRQHLTATDIKCDAGKKLSAIEFKSIATETFLAIAGITLQTF